MRPAKRSRQVGKTAFIYLVIAAGCVVIDKVYALFGHGVTSAAMSLMYLYPLLGGMLPFLLLWLLVPAASAVRGYRLFYNSYNSGMATLTIGSMLTGVFEIAGTASPYMIVFTVAGWCLIGFGLCGYLLSAGRRLL